LDGKYFDYQGAGEFFAIRSINNNQINIQVKLTPCSTGVTCMTGVSMSLYEGNVSMALTYTDVAPRTLKLYQNNIDVTANVPLTIDGVSFAMGSNQYGGSQWVITDSVHGITISVLDYYYMSTTFCVSSSLYFQIDGLMGLFDGNPNNDVVVTMSKTWVTLADPEDWRVSEADSNTHYNADESYDTINDPGFVGIVFDDNFTPNAEAEAACAGVTGPLQTACLQDVTSTGATEFADSAAGFSQLVSDLEQTVNAGGSSTGGGSTSDATVMLAGSASMLVVVLLALLPFGKQGFLGTMKTS